MRVDVRLTRAQLALLTDADVRALRGTTRKLADMTQRQASLYQSAAAALSREIKRRLRLAKQEIV